MRVEELVQQLADKLEESVTNTEKMTISQIKQLPSTRFKEDLLEQMLVAGLSVKEAELLVARSQIELVWYDSENQNFKRIINSMIRTALFGKNKVKESLEYEDDLLWIQGITLSLFIR